MLASSDGAKAWDALANTARAFPVHVCAYVDSQADQGRPRLSQGSAKQAAPRQRQRQRMPGGGT